MLSLDPIFLQISRAAFDQTAFAYNLGYRNKFKKMMIYIQLMFGSIFVGKSITTWSYLCGEPHERI